MRCSKCNFENPNTFKFCGNCGAPLIESQIREEKKLITVIFSDLSGFTALSQHLDPEDLRDVINICFEALNKKIINYGGTIHKYEGDLIVALFGIPTAHEDDPERAVRVALEMMRTIPRINEDLTKRLNRKIKLGLHIGIATGTVVAGMIGTQAKMEYTVIGEIVNLAARLKDCAQKGEILVSEDVFRLTKYLYEYEALSPVALKGIEKPVNVFRVIKIKDKPERKRGIPRLYSPLVGRTREVELLCQAVRQLHKGRGGVVFIIGEAGLGKTRLLEEIKKFVEQGALASTTIFEAQCPSYGEALTYWPFLQIFEKIYEINDSDSPEMIKEKLTKKSKELYEKEWKDILPYIGYLFTIRFSDELDEKVKYLDAKSLKTQIFASVKKLLFTLARIKPIILVIDDYHWIDSASLELLEFIFDNSTGVPLLFIGLSRPEKDKECWNVKERIKQRLEKSFMEIMLKPLDLNQSDELVHNLLKVLDIPNELKEKILSKAEGNPFYLEEIIRSFIDSNILSFKDNRWRLSIPYYQPSVITLPNTIQAVIQSRLDKIEGAVKDILQTASVIGRTFYKRILKYVYNPDDLMLELHLAKLMELEFINEYRIKPELEYVFKHPLIQEVAYNTLLKDKRKLLHLRTAECIENIYQERITDFCELLAEQYYMAEKWEEALRYCKMSAKKAEDMYANKRALDFYERALAISLKLNLIDEATQIHIEMAKIFTLQGENARAKVALEMALKDAKDKDIQFRIFLQFANLYEKMSKYDEAIRYINLAEQCITESISIRRANLLRLTAWIQYLKGEIIKAGETIEQAFSILKNVKDVSEKEIELLRARLLSQKATLHADLGDTQKTITFYQESLALYKKHNDLMGVAVIYNNLGSHLQDIGKFSQAIAMLENSLEIDEKIGNALGQAIVCNNLGEIYFYLNDLERSEFYFSKYAEINLKIHNRLGDGYALLGFGRIHQARLEYDSALKKYNEAINIFDEVKSERMRYFAMCDLLDLYIQMNEFTKGESIGQKIIDYARANKNRALLIKVYTLLGKMRLAQVKLGKREFLDSAQESLQMAKELAESDNNIIEKLEINIAMIQLAALCDDLKKFADVIKETRVILDLLKEGIADDGLRAKFLQKAEIRLILPICSSNR